MSTRFYSMIGGYRFATDTVTVSLNEDEAKELIKDVLRFMEGTTPGVITDDSRAWLDEPSRVWD